MAKVSFKDVMTQQNNTSNNSSNSRVSFFSLKNDKDTALVRFMYDSVDDFEILSYHQGMVNGKDRKINCVRGGDEPISSCPLCSQGLNTSTRIFIRLIHYTVENGQVVATPKVWERSIAYAKQLSDFINMYGSLKTCLFQVTRNGVAGSRDTSYSIAYAPEKVYPSESYPYTGNEFDGYSALGTIVIDATKEDLEYYVNYGMFPQQEDNRQTTSVTPPMNAQVNPTPSPMNTNNTPLSSTPWSTNGLQQSSTQGTPPFAGIVPPKRVY